jgi:beta-phosphoglucomutase-like phosphatase (HAD superfamily)
MDGLMFDSERIAIGLWRAAGLSEGWEIPDPLLLALSAIPPPRRSVFL